MLVIIQGGIELGGIFVNNVTPGGPAAHSQQINAGIALN